MSRISLSAFVLSLAATTVPAAPLMTGTTGNGTAFDNYQPSLTITQAVPLAGIYPSTGSGGSANGGTLGFVYGFAGNFAPGSSSAAQGQLLPISQNTAVFSLLGTQYGGNGQTNFAVPDLAGRAVMGSSAVNLNGVTLGTPTQTLTPSQLPQHDHGISGDVTGDAGAGQAFDNTQPVLSLRRLIATQGLFPGQGGNSGSAAFIGQVATFAGNFTPAGWMEADGRLLPIASNTALFALIGTLYGGDGQTTFALPDLRDRVSVGAGGGLSLGTVQGSASTTLTVAQMPAHTHSLPGGGNTDPAGTGAPVSNLQPSLALNYLIALSGIFPSNGGGGSFDVSIPYLGQITEFAGTFAPSGWALAQGQLMSIAQNQALFALLGTQYGGDGITTFALPDFRGRTALGAGQDDFGNSFAVGEQVGSPQIFLNTANLPAHAHTLPEPPINGVPEPGSLMLLLGALFALVLSSRRDRLLLQHH